MDVVLVTRADHIGTHVPWLPGARGASWLRGLPLAVNDSGYRAIAVRPARLGRA